METARGSISIDLSKISVQEDMSMFKASMEEAVSRLTSGEAPEAISNERIQEGNELLDTYKVVSPAIDGGMGSVWRVFHKSWNTFLAMKRPQPKFFTEGSSDRKEVFLHECEAWIDLGLHPNIVSCYYIREIGGVPTIFSEWMDGGSLEDMIDSGALYEGAEEEVQKRLLNIAIQFARGLRYAHEKGRMIHQDVKPDNLLLSKDWEVKVSDFGLAAVRSHTESAVKGMTRAYCSPEQAGNGILTIRTDIYSWALSVLEMYLKGKPWEEKGKVTGPKAGRLCREYFRMEKIPVPEKLEGLLERCLKEDPEERPDSFAEVEKELLGIYEEVTGETFPLPEPEAASGTAASLNNRALSFLDLNHPAEAEASWEQALEADPGHAESLYNYALWRWREGQIDDTEALHLLETGRDSMAKDRLTARLELERGNADASFEKADEEDRLFAEALRGPEPGCYRFPRILGQHPLLSISPGEDLILCGEEGAILYSAAEQREKWRDMDLLLSDRAMVSWNDGGGAHCTDPEVGDDDGYGAHCAVTGENDGDQFTVRTPKSDLKDNDKIVFREDGSFAEILSLSDSETAYMAQRKTQITVYDSAVQPVHVFSLEGWGLPPFADFTPDGDLLSVSVDQRSHFFDPDKGEKLPCQLPGNCLAITKAQGERLIALFGGFQKIQLVKVMTGRCLRSVPVKGLRHVHAAKMGRNILVVGGPAGRGEDLLFHMRIPQFLYQAGWELSLVKAPSQQLRLEREFRSLLSFAQKACEEGEYRKALAFAEQAAGLDESLCGNREAAALRRKILSHGRKTALLGAEAVRTIQAQSGRLWFSQDDELLLIGAGEASCTLNLETGEVTDGIDPAQKPPEKQRQTESTYWIRPAQGYSSAVSQVLRGSGFRYEAMVEWRQNTEDDAEEDFLRQQSEGSLWRERLRQQSVDCMWRDRLRLRAAWIETDGNRIDPSRGLKKAWAVELPPGSHYDLRLRFLADQRTLLLMQELNSGTDERRLYCMFRDMRDGKLLREWSIPLERGDFFSSLQFCPNDSLALMERQTDRRDESGFFHYILTDFKEIVMADGTVREPLRQKPQYLRGKNHSVISNRLQYTGVGDQILYVRDPGTVALTQLRRGEELEIKGDYRIPADVAISRDGMYLAVAGGEGTGEVFVYRLEWEYVFDGDS